MHRSQGSSMVLLERLLLTSFASPGGLTRLDLEELTGLSRTVVAGVVASLVARGELVEMREPPVPGARGRPPARYQRAALLPPVLLIQLGKDGATSVSCVHGDGTRSEAVDCASWSAPWPAWSRSVTDSLGLLSARSQAPPRLAVVSAPFPVAEGRGLPRTHEVPAGEPSTMGLRMPRSPWLEEDPRPALTDHLGCTTLLVNDANLAALGEAHFGAGRGRRAIVHVCVVSGVGAGFVFEGRLFTGAHGFSGELAHVQVTPDGAACPCGNRGCLATEARCLRGHAGGTSRASGEQADLGSLGSLVGHALAPLVTALDPDCVVVDARLADRAAPFMAGVTSELARRCPRQLAENLAVVAGELEDAERFGALAAADAHAAALVSQSGLFLRNLRRITCLPTSTDKGNPGGHFCVKNAEITPIDHYAIWVLRFWGAHKDVNSVTQTRVLIVEDDPSIVDLMRSNLAIRGFDTLVSTDGIRALDLLDSGQPDIVLLDLMLPEADGFEVCRQIRERSPVPIIVVSACRGELDKVTALRLGADDYMTKPFGINELMARILARLRRTRPSAGYPGSPGPVITIGDVRIDLTSQEVQRAGAAIHLTPTEFALLRELATNRGRLLTPAHLLRSVWGPGYATETDYVRIYMWRLRTKLEPPGSTPLIITQPRAGYWMSAD